VALEGDNSGRVRTPTLDDPWQPDFERISRREAKAYTNAELRWSTSEQGRRRWWRLPNDWLNGRTRAEALDAGDYEPVWIAANAQRASDDLAVP
jgi:hypothetical protein